MGGTDTARGMNFQYASAIGLILDFFDNPDWDTIQMEGSDDIEDAQVFNADRQLVLRAQVKQKQDPYQWQPHEIRDVLAELSNCTDSEYMAYQFVYSGSDGLALTKDVKPILAKVKHEGRAALTHSEMESLTCHLGETVAAFVLQAGQRLDLVKRESWQSVQASDLRRLRRLLAQSSSIPLGEGKEEDIYNTLFVTIAQKSESQTKYSRQLTRSQILGLLKVGDPVQSQPSLDVSQYLQWMRGMSERWISSVVLTLQQESAIPDILSLTLQVTSEVDALRSRPTVIGDVPSVSLGEALHQFRQLALVGDPGSGKSVALLQLVLEYCDEGSIETPAEAHALPVLIDLADYEGETIAELISRSFQIAGQWLAAEELGQLARQGRLALLLDDYDEVRPTQMAELQLRLRTWCAVHRACTVVVSTYRPSHGHNLALPVFRLQSLTDNQRRQILQALPGLGEKDMLALLHGLPKDSKHLLDSPLTLRMLAYTYVRSGHRLPTSTGSLFRETVDGVFARSEEKGNIRFERSDKANLLAHLAKWMLDRSTSFLSPAALSVRLDQFISGADVGATNAGHLRGCDLLALRAELVHSGLLRARHNGDIEFVHPTFRAYFASLAVVPDEIPALVSIDHWHLSLIFFASLRRRDETDLLVDELSRRPILLGRVIRERSDNRESIPNVQSDVRSYFGIFDRLFKEFIDQFAPLLIEPPWASLARERLQLIVADSSESGYMLAWREAELGPATEVLFVPPLELNDQVSRTPTGLPLPIWLVPAQIVKNFHPLELAYFWVVRSLYDLLEFSGWQAGFDDSAVGEGKPIHPAIANISSRFLIYHDFARQLPADTRALLPAHASEAFTLVIEVDENLEPHSIVYGVSMEKRTADVSVVQSVLRPNENLAPLFQRDEHGIWQCTISGALQNLTEVGEVDIIDLMAEAPDIWARKQLKADLERALPGFPPMPW